MCAQYRNAYAIATEALLSPSKPMLGKQRKRRKKKTEHDRLFAPTQIAADANTMCDCYAKPCDTSCNSISARLNYGPSACVCCHLNGIECREQIVPSHCSSVSCQQCHFRPNHAIPGPRWGQQPIDSIEQNYDCQSSQQHFEQLQRFAIYENLCEYCGFAIGNGSYHMHCMTTAARENPLNNHLMIPNAIENIYENICETCHSIYDGDYCGSGTCNLTPLNQPLPPNVQHSEIVDVLIQKPSSAVVQRQFGKQFSEFLGSFKQKLSPKSTDNERKKPKLQIVHNVGEVFKTNQTFDLNEIAQLKNQQIQQKHQANATHEAHAERNTYGKLRKSGDNSTEKLNKSSSPISEHLNQRTLPAYFVRPATSESNFLANSNYFASTHLQSPFSESIVSDTILYSNSYKPPSYEDAIYNGRYASVLPFNQLNACMQSTYNDSTSASSFYTFDSSSAASTLPSYKPTTKPAISTLLATDSSLNQWVTSLRYQIDEYGDDSRLFKCDAIKCVPSQAITIRDRFPQPPYATSNDVNEMCDNSVNGNGAYGRANSLQRRVERFKEKIMEQKMRSKRNAIYIKSSIGTEFLDGFSDEDESGGLAVHSVDLMRSNQNICSTSINCDGSEIVLRRQRSVSNESVTEIRANDSLIEQDVSYQIALATSAQYLQMLKNFYMTEVTISTSLNPISLVCGDRKLHFLVKFLVTPGINKHMRAKCENGMVQPTKYTNFQRIIATFERNRQNNQSKRVIMNINPMRVNALEKNAHQVVEFANTADFNRQNIVKVDNKHQKCNQQNPDYSSLIIVQENAANNRNPNDPAGCKQSKANEDGIKQTTENIYQPIWICKTVGMATDIAYDSDSLNYSDGMIECNDDTLDVSEWEQAEQEFVFSTDRMALTKHRLEPKTVGCGTDNVYRSVCILYSSNEAKFNKILYDCNVNALGSVGNEKCENFVSKTVNILAKCENVKMPANAKKNAQNIDTKFGSVSAWMSMLRSCDYIDDEEDLVRIRLPFSALTKIFSRKFHQHANAMSVKSDFLLLFSLQILSESYLLDKTTAEYNNQNNRNLQSVHLMYDDSKSDTTKGSIRSACTTDTELSSNSPNSTILSTASTTSGEKPSRRESGIFNKCMFDVYYSSFIFDFNPS